MRDEGKRVSEKGSEGGERRKGGKEGRESCNK